MGIFDRLMKPKKSDQPQTPPACILIVSDDDATAMQVRQDLVESGFSVCYGTTVATAINILDDSIHVDLIIGDFTNPETDGKAFLTNARIRRGKKAFPPVVFLMDTESDELVAKNMGVGEVLNKPVDRERLVQCVRSRVLMPQ